MSSMPKKRLTTAGGTDRIYYDTVVSGQTVSSYPMPGWKVTNSCQRFAPRLLDIISSVKWRADNHTTGAIIDNILFANAAEIAAWRNANVPHVGVDFTEVVSLRPYDDIDTSIMQLDKLYGVNRLYAGIAGRRGYRWRVSASPNPAWDAGNWMLHAMFMHMHPGYIGSWTDFRDNGGAGACWLGCNDMRRYGMPRIGFSISVPSLGSGGRRVVVDPGIGTTPAPVLGYALENDIVSPAYGIFYTYGTDVVVPSFGIDNLRNSRNRRYLRQQVTTYGDSSAVIIFKVASTVRWAIYIKPLGIDQIYLNWFDESLYDLEVVWMYKGRQPVLFRNANSFITYRNPYHDHILVKKGAWLYPSAAFTPQGMREAGWYNKGGEVQYPDAYFRLRDKVTGKVGRLSRSKVVLRPNQTNAPAQFIVMPADGY